MSYLGSVPAPAECCQVAAVTHGAYKDQKYEFTDISEKIDRWFSLIKLGVEQRSRRMWLHHWSVVTRATGKWREAVFGFGFPLLLKSNYRVNWSKYKTLRSIYISKRRKDGMSRLIGEYLTPFVIKIARSHKRCTIYHHHSVLTWVWRRLRRTRFKYYGFMKTWDLWTSHT